MVVAEGKRTVFTKKFKNERTLVKIDLKNLIDNSPKSKSEDSLFVVYFSEIDKKGKKSSGARLLTITVK